MDLWDQIKKQMNSRDEQNNDPFSFVDDEVVTPDHAADRDDEFVRLQTAEEYVVRLEPWEYVLIPDDHPLLEKVVATHYLDRNEVVITAKTDVHFNVGNIIASIEFLRYRQTLVEIAEKREELLKRYNIE